MRKHRFVLPALVGAVLAGLSAIAVASSPTEQVTPGAELHQESARQGWFWYRDPKKEKPKEETVIVAPPKAPKEEKPSAPVVVVPKVKVDESKLCQSKDTWEAKCGFVDPGDDFEFQARQRDILLQQMSLRPDNPDAVEAAQRYMKWVVGKASQVANMWYFNQVQNPELDPTVKNPISQVGIALASRVTEATQAEYFRLIREEGGVLFYFTRNDCAYCHDQAPYTQRVARTMGLQLINVPLDGQCLEGFEGDNCADNIKPEQVSVLRVEVVPALFLHVPDNTWIRLGTGVVTDTTVLANTVNFFSAYRAAMLNGLDNSKGARPSVTFDPTLNSRPSGTAPADGSASPGQPDRAKIIEMLGYKNAGGAANASTK